MTRISTGVTGALLVCLLAVAGVAHADTVPIFGGPGVPSPGFPDFWGTNGDATLTRNRNGSFTLSVVGSAANFNIPGASYRVGNGTMNITAIFSSKGVFTSGTYTLTGSLPASSSPTSGSAPTGFSWGAQPTETLLTANFTADAVDSSDEALGFTEIITGGWADQAQFTSGGPESVWLYSLLSGTGMDSEDSGNDHCLRSDSMCMNGFRGKRRSSWDKFLADLVSGQRLTPKTLVAIGSIATVPLPGAAWLLGTGLAGLIGLAHRRRRAVAA